MAKCISWHLFIQTFLLVIIPLCVRFVVQRLLSSPPAEMSPHAPPSLGHPRLGHAADPVEQTSHAASEVGGVTESVPPADETDGVDGHHARERITELDGHKGDEEEVDGTGGRVPGHGAEQGIDPPTRTETRPRQPTPPRTSKLHGELRHAAPTDRTPVKGQKLVAAE